MTDILDPEHAQIDENQVVDRYLLGQLPAAEAEAFEQHYLHCQRCLDRLAEAEAFQRAVKLAAAEVAAAKPGRWGVVARPRRLGLIAAALLAALLLLPALLYRELHQAGRELEEATRPRVNTPIFTLGPERGGPGASEPSHIVRLGADPEWIVLSLDLGFPEHESYRATLLLEGEEVWRGEGLRPDAGGALTLSFLSTFLESGDYRLQVSATPSGGEPVPAADFAFRVP